MRTKIASTLLFICQALTAPALARTNEPPPDPTTVSAKAHFGAGRAFLAKKRYDDAIREFELGYRLKPLPLFLYNIGRVAQVAGRPARAYDAFEAYLRAAPNATDRVEVQRWVASLREPAAEARAKESLTTAPHPGEAPPPATVSAAPPAATVAPATPQVVVPFAPPPETVAPAPASNALIASPAPPPDKRKRTLWIVLGSVGGALVVGGVVTAIAVGTHSSSGSPAGFHDLGNLSLAGH